MLAQLVQWFGGHALDVTGDVLQTAGTGAKVGVGAAAGATVGAAKGAAAGASKAIASSSLPAASQSTAQYTRAAAPATATDTEDSDSSTPTSTSLAGWREDTLQKALDDASAQLSGGAAAPPRASDLTTTSGKSGWCLVGEARGTGTRTCAPVGVNDVCMSGDIFPTQDVCVNPSLRA